MTQSAQRQAARRGTRGRRHRRSEVAPPSHTVLGLLVVVGGSLAVWVLLAMLGLWLPRRRRDRGLPVAHVDRMTSLGAFRGRMQSKKLAMWLSLA